MMTSSQGNAFVTPPWISWGSETSPTLMSSSPYIQEIICRNCRRRDLPDLIASLPPHDTAIPRSDAIDIPRIGGRRPASNVAYSAPASPESIGQELRRIADDFDLNYRASTGRTSSMNTARSRSLSFLQQLPRFSAQGQRRYSTRE